MDSKRRALTQTQALGTVRGWRAPFSRHAAVLFGFAVGIASAVVLFGGGR